MDREAWQAAVHGVTKSQTRLSDFTFMHWRRQWQPTPVFLPGESQGRGSLVGCRLWGHTESDTTEATQQQQQLYKEDLENFARKTYANIGKVEILKENKYDKKEEPCHSPQERFFIMGWHVLKRRFIGYTGATLMWQVFKTTFV